MQAGSRPQSRPVPGASPRPPPPASAQSGATTVAATAPPYQVNTQTKVIDSVHGRILCIADIRGKLSALNDLARETNAKAVIHTGDFGFFEENSLGRINDRTLRHLTQYSPLIPNAQRTHLLSPENPPSVVRSTVTISLLSEFPLLLSGQLKLHVPVFTLWGACEDVQVLEKFRSGAYAVENLHILDEATTRLLEIGGVKLRLLGLGGALVPHKMFDNGEGAATIAGGQGTMWTTALQIGELVDTAQRVHDPTETRLLLTHASPGREGIIAQLALVVKADLTLSAGLHFRYGSSYNEFSVQGDFEGFRHKLLVGKESYEKVWESVKGQVDAVIDENQRVLLDKFISVIDRVPTQQQAAGAGPGAALTGEEPAWKNCWNWNLCDAAYGTLVLDVKEGRVSMEMKSQGFNYAYRRTATPSTATTAVTPSSPTANLPHAKSSTPALSDKGVPPHLANRASATSTPPPLAGGGSGSGAASGQATPGQHANANGTSGSATPALSDKAEREKQKRKEKKERQKAERAAAKDGAESGEGAPSEQPKPEEAGVASPATESTGARTPTSRKPQRNPWTLFVRLQAPANEAELREFFGEAREGILKVVYPNSFGGRQQKIAYVEFGDEAGMKAGLEKHAEKLKDTEPEVKVASDRESRGPPPGSEGHGQPGEGGGDRGGFRGGRGRGRGGRGGFAARGFAAAGLTRGGAPGAPGGPPKSNGDGAGGGQ